MMGDIERNIYLDNGYAGQKAKQAAVDIGYIRNNGLQESKNYLRISHKNQGYDIV